MTISKLFKHISKNIIIMNRICQIEVIKDGRDFAVRTYLSEGSIKEYRHPLFEEVLTEMVVDLQDMFEEKI